MNQQASSKAEIIPIPDSKRIWCSSDPKFVQPPEIFISDKWLWHLQLKKHWYLRAEKDFDA